MEGGAFYTLCFANDGGNYTAPQEIFAERELAFAVARSSNAVAVSVYRTASHDGINFHTTYVETVHPRAERYHAQHAPIVIE
jgi:hypothetical protein